MVEFARGRTAATIIVVLLVVALPFLWGNRAEIREWPGISQVSEWVEQPFLLHAKPGSTRWLLQDSIMDHPQDRRYHAMREEIPQWCWYNGQLLFALSDALAETPNMSLADFMLRFKQSQGLTTFDFNLKNQGLLLSLLYGLLVVPKEIWENKGVGTSFSFKTRSHFTITSPSSPTTDEFLRLLRNAIAHANFEVILSQGLYRFWNVNPKGLRNFEATISHANLGAFVAEIGKYFINEVRPANAP